MKTPMQEMLEWVRATLPMDLETPQMIEQKIESLLEKEKEVMCEFADDYQRNCFQKSADDYFKETFNTKEK
jgi:hypothetical protein